MRHALRVVGHFFLALVPGIAQVARGACLRGVGLFSAFVLALDAALMAPFLHVPHISKAVLLAAVVWVVSFVDGFTHGLLHAGRKFIESKTEAFRQVHALFLAENFEEAEELLLEMMGRYPLEPAVAFYLGVVFKESAREGKAKRFFKAAKQLDEEGQWARLAERE